MVGPIRIWMGAWFPYKRSCIQGHNNKFLRKQGSHPRLIILLQQGASFSSLESKLLLLEDFSRGRRRRQHISIRSGSTRQKTSRFIEEDLLLDLCSSNKDLYFQFGKYSRPRQHSLQRYLISNPNSWMIFLCSLSIRV